MARLNFLDFSTLWVAFGFRLFQAAYFINIQQLASNQDFSFFGANGNIILKFSGKSRKLKCATAGNRTTDLLLSGPGFSYLLKYISIQALKTWGLQVFFPNEQQGVKYLRSNSRSIYIYIYLYIFIYIFIYIYIYIYIYSHKLMRNM